MRIWFSKTFKSYIMYTRIFGKIISFNFLINYTILITITIFFLFRLLGTFPNTYTLTKLLAEQLINEERNNIPVVIFRPTIGE